VVGVNRVGEDGNGFPHSGNSAVIDFAGKVLFREIDSEVIHHHSLDRSSLDEFRQRFPAYLDADSFVIV
jgi:predicted amidohydrolase